MQLSYSSGDKIISCEQKYVYEKVMRLPYDPDANADTLAFRFGKAFHSICEWSEHELGYFEDKADEYMAKAAEEQGLTDNESLCYLYSCVVSSLVLWKQTGLRVVKCELKIEDEEFVGYIDFVAVDPNNGNWWIGDLKTTSMVQNISARLLRDPQLSLYCARKELIAMLLGLELSKFMGALYRETIKPRLVVNEKDTPKKFAARAMAESQMYIVPAADISEDQLFVHKALHTRAMQLHDGAMPLRNYKNCLAYNKRCDYWSRCYGKLGSDAHEYMLSNTMSVRRKSAKNGDFEVHSFSLAGEAMPLTLPENSQVCDQFGDL